MDPDYDFRSLLRTAPFFSTYLNSNSKQLDYEVPDGYNNFIVMQRAGGGKAEWSKLDSGLYMLHCYGKDFNVAKRLSEDVARFLTDVKFRTSGGTLFHSVEVVSRYEANEEAHKRYIVSCRISATKAPA